MEIDSLNQSPLLSLDSPERISKKNHYIKLLRDNGFNCFPIPQYLREADYRYKGALTQLDQPIQDNENFGFIARVGSGCAIVDFDNKEKYRKFAEGTIEQGYMVIESPHGWHIPIKNLKDDASKIELFDYTFQPDKKIIEIQGTKHYCVGAYSLVYDKHDMSKIVIYQNRGTDKIFDAGGSDFHKFIDFLCKELEVTARKKGGSSHKNLRDRFKEGLPPTAGTSNDYFFNAALQCNTDGLSRQEALEKIQKVYDIWTTTAQFSNRPFSSVEAKINEVYDNNKKIELGRPKNDADTFSATNIALEFIESRKIYSDVETHIIYENKEGFLKPINDTLKRELQRKYPVMTKEGYNHVLFKLEGLADPIPPTNKNLIVFKNGVRDTKLKQFVETNEIADMGFNEYDYLENIPDNEPKNFIKIMFGNVDKSEHPRIKAGLRAILANRLDSRISVIFGQSGTGKSTPLLILAKILKQYAMVAELDQILNDRFIRAKIKDVRLLILQDLPKVWGDFAQIKTMTGEQIKTERGFMQDSCTFESKLKIWASGNYLAKIPEHEKNAMYARRLSLIHNTKKEAYEENPDLITDIANEEGEKIISWILNIPDQDCKYEDAVTVKKEWEDLSSPEIVFIEENYIIDEKEPNMSIMELIKEFKRVKGVNIDLTQMRIVLENNGYIVKNNLIQNIRAKGLDA